MPPVLCPVSQLAGDKWLSLSVPVETDAAAQIKISERNIGTATATKLFTQTFGVYCQCSLILNAMVVETAKTGFPQMLTVVPGP